MFAQITSFRTAMGGMDSLRDLVRLTYLPLVRVQPGYLRDYFLEQVDDPDHAQLVVVWDMQAHYEKFRSSEESINVDQALRRLTLRIQSEGYVARTGTAPLSAPGLVS